MWKRNRKNYDEAKEIFIKYNGSHFQMEREFEYSKYKSYQVPKKIEKEWSVELIDTILSALETENNEKFIVKHLHSLEQLIIQYHDSEGLLLLVKFAKKNIIKFDTFTKVIVVETILSIVSELKLKDNQIDTINFAITILEDICRQPIHISESHLNNGNIPDYMSDEILKNRAKKEIENWKK